MVPSHDLHLMSLLKNGHSSEPSASPEITSRGQKAAFCFDLILPFCLSKEHRFEMKSEDGCPKGDLANR